MDTFQDITFPKVTSLSPYMRFGCISPRFMYHELLKIRKKVNTQFKRLQYFDCRIQKSAETAVFCILFFFHVYGSIYYYKSMPFNYHVIDD